MIERLAPSHLNSYINKRTGMHSYNTRFRENLDVPMCTTATAQLACVAGVRKGRERELGRAPRVSLAPETPFPFPFKRLPRRLLYNVPFTIGLSTLGTR